jgi:hypothetical protein
MAKEVAYMTNSAISIESIQVPLFVQWNKPEHLGVAATFLFWSGKKSLPKQVKTRATQYAVCSLILTL